MQQCMGERKRAGKATVVIEIADGVAAIVDLVLHEVAPGGVDLDLVAKEMMRGGTGEEIWELDPRQKVFGRPVYHI